VTGMEQRLRKEEIEVVKGKTGTMLSRKISNHLDSSSGGNVLKIKTLALSRRGKEPAEVAATSPQGI